MSGHHTNDEVVHVCIPEDDGPPLGDVHLARLLAGLVDTLQEEHATYELLHRLTCGLADLVPASEAGLLLVDRHDVLRLAATSDESAQVLELFQLQRDDGPCLESVRTGQRVVVADVTAPLRWPVFTARCAALGYVSLLALPLTVRGEVLGCANVFSATPEAARDEMVEVAQAVVETAAGALAMQRRLDDATTLAEQLDRALHSRVAIEQAKGILAEHAHIEVQEAFECLRRCARKRRAAVHVLAEQLVARTTTPAEVVASEDQA